MNTQDTAHHPHTEHHSHTQQRGPTRRNPEFRRTLLIGLGGAGQNIVMNVKRCFFDAYGVLPPSIKVLCLDTDVAQLQLRSRVSDRTYHLEPDEFMHLKVPDPRQYIDSGSAAGSWYVKPLPVGAIANGAGAVRQNGRLGLFYHIVEFRRRIDHLVAELLDPQLPAHMDHARAELDATTDFDLSNRDPEVFVCGSLAGGTGSGTVVDVGILLRDALPQALIQGCFVLDWPYRNKAFAARVRGNVYAALSEIDNLQSLMYGAADFVPYTVRYADKSIEVRDPPYSLFHLIDGRNEVGQNIDDVGQLCEAVATAVFLSASSMADQINSVVDNLLTHINLSQPRVWKGRYARYSSLGVSSIYYPARELQRLLTAESALRLCAAAIAEIESGVVASNNAVPVAAGDPRQQEVGDFLVRHGLDRRETIRDGVCPCFPDFTFTVEPFEISDPTLLKTKADGELANCETMVKEAAEGDGRVFVEAKLDVLGQKLATIRTDEKLTTAARRAWLQALIDRLMDWDKETANELSTATARVTDRAAAVSAQLEIVLAARYFPIFGGPRKSAAEHLAELVLEWLRASLAKSRLDQERRFYAAALERIQRSMPQPVKASEVSAPLLEAERRLRGRLRLAQECFDQVKSLKTQVLVGHGDIVVLPEGKSIALAESQTVNYAEFKTERDVHTVERYLEIERTHEGGIAAFLSEHCAQKLAYLTEVGVHEALETVGAHRGSAEDYLRARIDDLFRLSAPLWSFNRSRLTEVQSLQYDRIVNLGVYEQAMGREQYEEYVGAAKAKYHLQSDHTFSTTGDPHRIWLLAFAAALPVYFLSDLERSKERYEEEITPTYHIDPEFEMNAPDIFPTDAVANRVLRVLGMAIVRGIDVLSDEKLPKGHKFTCSLDSVRALNFGDPKIWAPGGPGASGTSFRDMYLEVVHTYDSRTSTNLLDLITAALRARVAELPPDQLRRLIGEHIERLRRKLEQRDFSKLYSARLTYREVKALEEFLSPRRYAMDLDRYLEGKA